MLIKYQKLRASYLPRLTFVIILTLFIKQMRTGCNGNSNNKLYDTTSSTTVCTQKGRDIYHCLYYTQYTDSNTGIKYLGCNTCTPIADADIPTVKVLVPLNITLGNSNPSNPTISVIGACQETGRKALHCDLYQNYPNQTYYCVLCVNNYIIVVLENGRNGCTSTGISNCATYSTTTLICATCSSGYTLQTLTNSSLGCTQNGISNCATYNSNTLLCSSCKSLYYLNQLTNTSFSCIPQSQIVQYCDIYLYFNQQFFCYSCSSNYSLLNDSYSQQICQNIQTYGCSQFSTIILNGQQQLYCDSCVNYFICIQDCLDYSNTPGNIICKTCLPNYKPTFNQNGASICLPNSVIIPFNCQQIDSQGQNGKINSNNNNNIKCLSCSQNNILNYQTNACIKQVLMCQNYKGNMCIQCESPYVLQDTNQAQECVMPAPINCNNYIKSNGNCIKCQAGYFLNSGKTCDIYKVCPNYQYLNTYTNVCINGQIQNCLTYLNANQCSQCQTNYKLDSLGFSCTYVAPPVICPSDTNFYKYQNILGICVKIDINCQYYLDNGYCYQCVNGYYEYNGSCFIKQSQQNLQTSTETTIICANDQYLVGINCIKIPSNCALFDKSFQLCESFSKGYQLFVFDRINMCVINCPQNTYPFNSQCVPVDQNCITFNYENNNCDLCIIGFKSNGNSCLPTTTNNDNNCNGNLRQWYNGLRCIEISQTCETFDLKTGQCWTCFSPYVITSPGNCGLNQASTILSCPKNTVQIANQRCVPSIINCKTYQLILGYCLTCFNGYQIDPALRTCQSISTL